MSEFKPDWKVPPGSVIWEALEDLEIPEQELANALGIDMDNMDDLRTGKMEIDHKIAADLGDFFVMSSVFWIRMENQFRRVEE